MYELELHELTMADLNSATVEEQRDLIFQAWRCILGAERHAIYVSGPITTGQRLIDAREAGAGQDGCCVLRANIAEIIESADRLRHETGRTVIEPGSLTIRTWTQDDYLALWTNLIERHIAEVRFLDGWDTSIGCALEYEQAARHGVDRCTLDGVPIPLVDALELLTQRSAALVVHKDDKLATLGARLAQVAERLRIIDLGA
jgi:hypothetical protein